MQKESLMLAREIIIENISNSEIKQEDKTELLINLYNLLEPKKYEENIKILSRGIRK